MVSRAPTPRTYSTENILSLLQQQLDLYAELADYAEKQRSLIPEEDTGPLLTVLTKRQKLSAKLGDLVRRLEPVRRDWVTYRTRFDSAQRLEAESLIADIKIRLRALIERDEADVRVLSAKKQAVASTVRSMHSAGQALSAYRDDLAGADRVNQLDEAS